MNKEDYIKFIKSIRETIVEMVISQGWDKSVDDIGILVKSVEIMGSFWQLDLNSHEGYTNLLTVVNELRDDYE